MKDHATDQLNIKMPHLERWNAARQRHAQTYTEQLRDVVEAVPVIKPWGSHVFCYYVVRVPERDKFRQDLEREGIGTNIHYPIPIHLQPAYTKYKYKRGTLPITEKLASRIVSLPMYPELTEEQLQLVISTVKEHIMSDVTQ